MQYIQQQLFCTCPCILAVKLTSANPWQMIMLSMFVLRLTPYATRIQLLTCDIQSAHVASHQGLEAYLLQKVQCFRDYC